MLAFRDDPCELILGNLRSNIIHSIHWLKGAECAVDELQQYISKTDLTETLICVDSRDLNSLRKHVNPS
ncbi:hypothetical protein FRC12_009480, partial [Ceratobasidium sp. 428]